MADKTIGSLPQAASLTDNSSFVCEDNGEAKRVTGKQFKDFAKEGASPAVKAAESAADRAEAAVAKTPKIQNGTWWTFDAVTQSYVDTGVEAQGQPGVPGEKGDPGEPGQPGEKGDPFRYEDFTPEQLDDLERGAKAAQAAAETAAASAATSAGQASVSEQNAAGSASAAAQSASSIGEVERIVTEKASEASSSAANAAASAEAAEKSAEKAANIAGGNFATKTEAQGYADTAESNAKSYTDQQISAIPTPDVSVQIGEHNTNAESHNDIRELIIGLTNRLNTLADSDDTTLDQFSEVVAYIKNNKSLIDGITTSKVNVADIINNLTTNVSNKPLSAAQGVALKALIDAITVPTKVSELENDSGYLTSYTETDPTVPAWAKATSKPSYTAGEVGAYTKDETNTLLRSKADKSVAFTVTLTAAGWADNAQTISNANFLSAGYAYTVAPASGSFADYADAMVYSDDVTTNGQMVFHCDSVPTADLTVNIVRMVTAE